MKKFLITLLLFLYFGNIQAAVPSFPGNPHAASIFFPVGKEGKKISLLELSTISGKSLEELTGNKMNRWERMAFKSSQRKIKKGVNENGEITSKKLLKLFDEPKTTTFNGGGLALGLLLGFLGVLIAYLIKDEASKSRQKWAWIGLGINVVLSIILVIALLNTIPW